MTLSVSGALVCSAACALLAFPAQAQTSFPSLGEPGLDAPRASVHGEVTGTAPYQSGLVVECRSTDGFAASSEVSGSGLFDFGDVPAGTYQFVVMDRRGNVLQRDIVTVPTPAVTLHLPPPVAQARPVSGTVSLARLQHKVPGKAIKEFERAASALKKRDREKAIAHLRKAVEIDPEFQEAFNNLGVQYLALGDNEKALEAFDRAVKLDPGSARAAANCASALFNLKRYPEAVLAARHALSLNSGLVSARYALGVSLAAQNIGSDEAIQCLRVSIEQFPAARLALAQLMETKGQTSQAREQLETYLSAASVPNRDKVELWLKELP